MLLGGAAVDVGALVRVGVDRFGPPSMIVSDRWREAELAGRPGGQRDSLRSAGPAGQGFKDGGEDVRAFRRAMAEGKVTPVESKLLRSAMGAARTVSDPAGNAKLAKGSQGGRRQRARDDAAAAAILAVSAGVRLFGPATAQQPEPELVGVSPFDRRYGA